MRQFLKITTIFLLVFLTFGSCESRVQRKSKNFKELVINDQIEADLLLMATQENLNTIALCDAIRQANVEPEVLLAAQTIRKEQEMIYQDLKAVARENMILVATRARRLPAYTLDEEIYADSTALEQLQKNLDVQKEMMDSLMSESNKREMLKVAQQSIKRIQSNIEITEETLESLR